MRRSRQSSSTRSTRLIVNSTSCVPPFVQLAGVAALEGPQDAVTAMVAEFRRRRDYLVPALNAIPGISCVEPGGAFYAFPNVSALPSTADEIAERLLDEAGVAVLAGSAFGARATDHLRISYASSLAEPGAGGRAHQRLRLQAAVTACRGGASQRPLARVERGTAFVDVHSHVVPSGDDGAKSIEQGLELCRLAFESGTGILFATPHVHAPWDTFRELRRGSSCSRSRSPRCGRRPRAGGSICGVAGRCIPTEIAARDPAEFVLEGTRAS